MKQDLVDEKPRQLRENLQKFYDQKIEPGNIDHR